MALDFTWIKPCVRQVWDYVIKIYMRSHQMNDSDLDMNSIR